jgi:hypothetical protein
VLHGALPVGGMVPELVERLRELLELVVPAEVELDRRSPLPSPSAKRSSRCSGQAMWWERYTVTAVTSTLTRTA